MSNQTKETYTLGVLHGDAIGPEIVPVSVKVADAAMKAVGANPIKWKELPLGFDAIAQLNSHIPESTLEGLAETDGWILGPHDSAAYPEPFKSQLNPSGTIRKYFDLFANIRPAKSFGVDPTQRKMDLVVVRENTEGFYADRSTYKGTGEFMPTPDVAIAMGIITRKGCERIAREAFELASRRRKHLTIVHKANVLKLTTGMFRDVCKEIAAEYPDVEVDDFHIDAFTVHLVRRAEDFDVIVTENMFGDILSDLTGELAGSLGIAPSLNASEDRAMAQASHGSAPDIAGQNRANPTAMILSTAMLLDWLGRRYSDELMTQSAQLIDEAVAKTILSGISTSDMGGSATCTEFGEEVARAVTDRAISK